MRKFIVGVAVGLSLECPTGLFGADWPQYRGPQHDGVSRETIDVGSWAQAAPRRLWKASVGIGFSGVTVSGGRVFTTGNNGLKKGGQDTVYCLDEATGRQIWAFSYPQDLDPKYYDGGPGATPTVVGDKVFIV
ncbi:MAG: alcohol dehydrogenase, partial [Chitinophagia bacterium]|nr:alcohol dehydrogenase [Chitinophagia bacterium]